MRTNQKPAWVAPEWMAEFLPLIVNTGGNSVADMMNGNADPRVNLPLSTLQACVKSQVGLLEVLRVRGVLDPSLKDVEKLCGYVGDGSHVTVKLSQDDATRYWCVQVERRSFYGRTMREAIKAALEGEQCQSYF